MKSQEGKSIRGSRSRVQRGKFEIRIRRVYDEAGPDEGARFLVDGLWPRGVRKDALDSVRWVREIAPSAGLRKWYGHDPEKWEEFQRRYRLELQKNEMGWKPLAQAVRESNVTLLTATREVEISHAAVLREFLERKASSITRKPASRI